MKAAIFFFVLTVGLTFVLKYVVTPNYYEDVQGRFLERLNYIPSQKPTLLSRDSLDKWLGDIRNTDAIRGYVWPVLFPLDYIFLVSLTLFLGFATVAVAENLTFLQAVPVWIWWIFPVIYGVSDFLEDSVVVGLFRKIIPLTESWYSLLTLFTKIKLTTVSMSSGQVGFLLALLALVHFFPAPR